MAFPRAMRLQLRVSLLIGVLILAVGTHAAESPLEAASKIQDISSAYFLISGTPSASKYLNDSKITCTVFPPDNAGLDWAMTKLGPHLGEITSNETMVEALLNFAIIPDKAIKGPDLANTSWKTRNGETLYITKVNGKLYAYGDARYPVEIHKTDLKAGKCLVHTVSEVNVPPSILPISEGYWSEFYKTNKSTQTLDKARAEIIPLAARPGAKKENATAAAAAPAGGGTGGATTTEAGATPAASPAPATQATGAAGGLRVFGGGLVTFATAAAAAAVLLMI